MLWFCLMWLGVASAQNDSWQAYQDAIEREQLADRTFFHRVIHPFQYDLDYARTVVGAGIIAPHSGELPGMSLRIRRAMFEVSVLGASLSGGGKALATLGLHSPVGPGVGSRPLGIRGMYARSFVALGGGVRGRELAPYVAGGLSLQVPFAVLEARVTVATGDQTLFQAYPELSIQLDGLFGLLDTNVRKTGTQHYTSHHVVEVFTGFENVGGHSVRAYDVYDVTEYHQSDWHMRLMPAFWGLSPRLSLTNAGVLPGVGLGLSGRALGAGLDLYAMHSAVNAVTWVGPSSLGDPLAGGIPDALKGTVQTWELSADGSINVLRVVGKLIFPRALAGLDTSEVQYGRVMFYLGAGLSLPGEAHFDDETAALALLDATFVGDVERTALTDPSQTQMGLSIKTGWGYELGPAQLRGVATFNPHSGTRVGLEVAYIFPGGALKRARE